MQLVGRRVGQPALWGRCGVMVGVFIARPVQEGLGLIL